MLQGPSIAERYRIQRRLSDASANAVWLAEDERTGFLVLATVVPLSRARLLGPAIALQHPHMASLIDLVDDTRAGDLPDGVKLERGACITIAEWISGTTLYDQLLDGRMSIVPAVRTVASIASAVSAMHERGAVHGALSTRSIVTERADGGTVPVLTQGAVPADGSFCSLERLEGRGPSEEDDAWALHVVLYNALTGRRPYRARTHDALLRALRSARPLPLAALDVEDPALNELLEAGLAPSARTRRLRAPEIESALYGWLGQHAGAYTFDANTQDTDSSAPHIDIGTFVEASAPGFTVETPTVLPPPATVDLHVDDDAQRPSPIAAIALLPQQRPADEHAPAQSQAAEASHSEEPQGDEPQGDEPQGDEPQGDEPQGDEPQGDEPQGDEPQPEVPAREAESAAVPSLDSPASPATPLARSAQVAADKHHGSWLLLFIAALGAGAIAAAVWLISSLRGAQLPAAASAPAASTPPPPSLSPSAPGPAAPDPPSPAQSASAAAPALRQNGTPADIAACTARWFPAQTFQAGQDLAFVCAVHDPRDGIKRMRRRIVVGARGALTQGMSEWSRLGWYQLAIMAAVRGDCCPNLVAFDVPEIKVCPRLDAALDALAGSIRGKHNVKEALSGFETAAECIHRVQPQDYPYSFVPKSGGQITFDEVLARVGR